MQNEESVVAVGKRRQTSKFKERERHEHIVIKEAKGNRRGDSAASKWKAKVGRFSEKGEAG